VKKILVDTNVLLDVVTNDPNWFDWSVNILDKYAHTHTLCINAIIYAELSIGFKQKVELDDFIKEAPFHYLSELPLDTLFLAGKVFLEYKKSGGNKTVPLPDFFIGAHAITENIALITRDKGHYQTYFPTLKLIMPHS